MTTRFHVLLLLASSATIAMAQPQNNFTPPRASIHFAPDRSCDLLNVSLDIDVDYPTRTYKGTVVNTMSAFRSGTTEVMLMAGQVLKISKVTVDGTAATYRHENNKLYIATRPLNRGVPFKVAVTYSASNTKAQSFGGRGGFHWIEPNTRDKNHMGFWTQGETESNSDWIPTWDYPNDMATSEIRCTTQSDWDVVGNGSLVSTTLSPDKKRKTFDWKMTQPHAMYLLTLCGGPLDIKKDRWEGVDLWYVVPKGQGDLIEPSFGDTKDMLSFFSQKLGVKYAWPKYAQNAMFDFGGGMENVSATTLGSNSLTETRDGFRTMASLNSHELGHQWFGDLVTCKDWSDTWLNESFATFMQLIYFEHSRGADAYAWEVDDATRSYLSEARRYQRPISTKLYSSGDAMFDSHTYPKGGVVLHTLRRSLGDSLFFGSLNAYLNRWRHTPVESSQLRRAFTEYTGVEAERFWAQWFEKPGHPVLDYTWKYENGKLLVTVKQTQGTANGTPIYAIKANLGISTGNVFMNRPVNLSEKEQTFEIALSEMPKAVLLDPTHDFLREIPNLHWSADELPTILEFAPNAPDRAEAMRRLLLEPTDANVQLIAKVVASDRGVSPAFRQVASLGALEKPYLRDFWMGQLNHANFSRRAQAVSALQKLPKDDATIAKIRSLITDKDPIEVVVASIRALAEWDAKGNADIFRKAQTIKDHRNRISAAAKTALSTE